MKLKKLFAIALTGVMALSVLTGCGDSTSTKSIADAMSDMGKAEGITVKADSKLDTKAKAVVAALKAEADKSNVSTEALLAVLEEADGDEQTPTVTPSEDEDTSILTAAQKKAIMDAMGDTYKDQFVWIAVTETKGYNTTAQASNLFHGMILANDISGKEPAATYYVGTTTVTSDGTSYRFAVMTAKAEAQAPKDDEKTDPKPGVDDSKKDEGTGDTDKDKENAGTTDQEGQSKE